MKNIKLVASAQEGTVRMRDTNGLIAVSCIQNFRGEWRWNSAISGRAGKKNFSTKKAALIHGIKSMGLKVEWVN